MQPRWQRRGVGSALMQALLARWPQIYQTMLCTDDTPKTVSFYESWDLRTCGPWGARGFMRIHRGSPSPAGKT